MKNFYNYFSGVKFRKTATQSAKGTFFSLLLATCAAFSACNDEVEYIVYPGKALTLEVKTAGIESRGLIESATLPDGHSIGVSLVDAGGTKYDGVTYHNIEAQASTGKTPQVWTLKSDVLLSSTDGTLHAYYPYSSSVTNMTQIAVTAGQTDWMYAEPVTGLNDGKAGASITMKHALAAVRLKIVKGTYTGAGAVTKITVKGDNIAHSGKLNARTGALSAQASAGTVLEQTVSFTASSTATVKDFIFVPVASSAAPTFTLTVDGKEYTATGAAVTAAQGNLYNYTLTIDNKVMTLSDVTVGEWGYNESGNPVIQAGYKVTIAGNTEGIAFSNKVNDDGSVTITAMSSVTDYEVNTVTVAGTASYTSQLAADGTRTVIINTGFTQDVTVTFNGVKPKIKVYAVNKGGYLIDYNEGDASCTGVAVVAGSHKFMIAKNDATDGTNKSLYYDYDKGDLSLTNYIQSDGINEYGYLPKPDGSYEKTPKLSDDFTTWTAGALSDFNGKANTQVIAASSSNSRDMCKVLETFNVGSDNQGHSDWYVPACGQLALMYLARTDIEAALANIGSTALGSVNYWSSSEAGTSSAWLVNFKNGRVDWSGNKDYNSGRVRFIRDYTEPLKGTIDLTTAANGVYAVAKNGKGVNVTDADASCMAVALIIDNQRIMIPKTDATDGTNNTLYWGKNLYGKDVAGITETTDQSVAKTDFNGKANTDAIIAAYGQHSVGMDSRDMCKVLASYAEGGFTDWYVPAAGQLYEMYNKKSDINTALQNIGGTALESGGYWSSSESDVSLVWRVSFNNGAVGNDFSLKNIGYRVRFVRDIKDMIYFHIYDGSTLKLTLRAEKGMTWREWVNSEYNTIEAICGNSGGYVGFEGNNYGFGNVTCYFSLGGYALPNETIISGQQYNVDKEPN